MDKAAFISNVRASLFGGVLKPSQFAGIEAILNAAEAEAIGKAGTSYVLATTYHETMQSMFPNRENLNYGVAGLIGKFGRHRISENDARRLGRKPGEPALSLDRQIAIGNLIYGGAWGLENLGNTQPNDGWHFRGGGMDHCTGRKNWRKVATITGLGDALMTNPDLILDPVIAAKAIVTGMKSGRYTNKKLSDYLPITGHAWLEDFIKSRYIINGQDRALDIARYAMKWQTALEL
jgi:putative chitinase